MDQSVLMTPQEAAAFLKLYPDTLKKWRRVGKGPKFHKMGSRCIRYVREELEEWLGLQSALIRASVMRGREGLLIGRGQQTSAVSQ